MMVNEPNLNKGLRVVMPKKRTREVQQDPVAGRKDGAHALAVNPTDGSRPSGLSHHSPINWARWNSGARSSFCNDQ
jgi:hypothetical protein